jgi:signal transduction histidine kinase
MKTRWPGLAKLADWFRVRTEGKRILQWITYVMIFSVLLVFILANSGEEASWRFYATVLALAALLVVNVVWDQSLGQPLSSRRERVYNTLFFVAADLLALGSMALTGRGEVIFLLFMQTAQFASVYGTWPAGTLFSVLHLAAILWILRLYGADNASLIQAGSQLSMGVIFVLVFVVLVDRYSEETHRAERLLKDLQAANIELKAAQQREKELAIAEERMRLARDIHDGLGHHLTVLSIQLQAADKLVERNPKAAAEAIHLSRAEAQAALEEVRRSVGMMRDRPAESQPLVEMLNELIRDFEQRTGLASRFECSGEPAELSPFAHQTLFRAVQESLTNVQKHGRQVRHIQVRLAYTPEAIRLTVTDDGRNQEAGPAGEAGYGLQGLRERVDQLGGEFCCGAGSSGGFEVDVRIPLQEVTGDPGPAG